MRLIDADKIPYKMAVNVDYEDDFAHDIQIATKGAIDRMPTVNCSEFPNNSDTISRQAAIEVLCKQCTVDRPETCSTIQKGDKWCEEVYTLLKLPSAQPEIIHCGECIYYDPPHVEKEDARYEYSEMPKEAFDVLGTGLVSAEYGINIGGRCCVDYYCKNYSDDKRVFVREDNYCGRAERRTDE